MRPYQEEFFIVLYREYFNQIKLYAIDESLPIFWLIKSTLKGTQFDLNRIPLSL